MEAVSNLTNPC